MQLNTRALLSLLPAAFVLPATITSTPRVDGYVITMRVSGGPNAVGDVTFKTAGDKMRIEADANSMMGGGRGGLNAEGAYMLPGMDGNIIMVLPKMTNPMGGGTGFAVSVNPAGMMAARGAAPPPVGDVSIDDLGAGESILGHATHKYRIKPANPDEAVEVWIATDIPLDYKKFASAFGARFTGTDARMVAKIPNGFALKVVGKTGTMEVTKIDKASFDDSEFQVPAGIQVMDLSGMMGGRGRGRGN
jgi:hypothetical protein